MSYFPGYQVKQWQFVSGVIALDSQDHGAEFFRGANAGFPDWLPDPVPLVGVQLTYLEAPGCSGSPLYPASYGFMSVNTDPGGVWHAAGGSPQNQTVPEDPHAMQLGELPIRYMNPRPSRYARYPAPIYLNANDGLVLDQVGYGGGNVQCIWRFLYLVPKP
jgi:hypothetical protein